MVSAIILSDPSKYNTSFLGGGMSPEAYAEWICGPQWGGIPELKILSEFYSKELCVVDIGEGKIHKFGSGPKIYLMYDGTHYNLGVKETTRIFEED